MVIFHSYVSLPEGKETTTIWPYGTSATILRKNSGKIVCLQLRQKHPKEYIGIWRYFNMEKVIDHGIKWIPMRTLFSDKAKNSRGQFGRSEFWIFHDRLTLKMTESNYQHSPWKGLQFYICSSGQIIHHIVSKPKKISRFFRGGL